MESGSAAETLTASMVPVLGQEFDLISEEWRVNNETTSLQNPVYARMAHLEHELESTKKQLRTLEAKVETGTMLPPYWPFGSALDRALFFGYLSSTAMVLLGFALGFGWI